MSNARYSTRIKKYLVPRFLPLPSPPSLVLLLFFFFFLPFFLFNEAVWESMGIPFVRSALLDMVNWVGEIFARVFTRWISSWIGELTQYLCIFLFFFGAKIDSSFF